MIRMALITDAGPIGIVGINDENVLRMRAGMPLDINIDEITPPGQRIRRLVVHLGHTYEHVVDDMQKDGLPVTDDLRQQARDLDSQLLKERRERARKQVESR